MIYKKWDLVLSSELSRKRFGLIIRGMINLYLKLSAYISFIGIQPSICTLARSTSRRAQQWDLQLTYLLRLKADDRYIPIERKAFSLVKIPLPSTHSQSTTAPSGIVRNGHGLSSHQSRSIQSIKHRDENRNSASSQFNSHYYTTMSSSTTPKVWFSTCNTRYPARQLI